MREFGISADVYRQLKRSQKYSVEHVFHALVKEPFNADHATLGRLTPVVVRHVFFRQDGDDPNGVTTDLKEFDRRMRKAEGQQVDENQFTHLEPPATPQGS